MALDNGVVAAISGVIGVIATKAVDFFLNRKKESVETDKVIIETKALTAKEERERAIFFQEQLEVQEELYKNSQAENEKLRDTLKKLMRQLDELQKKTNETLNDITFLKTSIYHPHQ